MYQRKQLAKFFHWILNVIKFGRFGECYKNKMKTKLVSALVLIGIAAWVGFNSLGGMRDEKNLQVDPLKLISTVE